MYSLNEDNFLRKCYFKREQVPTQTVMKKKMQALADVYFKSMTPKLKVLAGLEPPMKGGGSDWYVPPADVLRGKMVMKPCKKEYLSKLGYKGIDEYTEKFFADHNKNIELEKIKAIEENDNHWMKNIKISVMDEWDLKSKEQAKLNTAKILEVFAQFEAMYRNSFVNIERILLNASAQEIVKVKQQAYDKMNMKYKDLLKKQATSIYDRLTARLLRDKEMRKQNFLEKVEEARTAAAKVAHDINVDKHTAIEKLRHLLACQRLACQVYVALKEKEAQDNEIQEMKHEHQKKNSELEDKIKVQNYNIAHAKEKEKARQNFIRIWKKKVCHVVKTFQEFVSYCLRTLPEQAEFFINMEQLLMLQLTESLDNPEEESLFEEEQEEYKGPIPSTRPFIVYGDYGVYPEYNDDLCPSRRGSNLSHLPVVVVNKRCVYTVCDSLRLFTDKMEKYARDRLERDIQDDHDYTHDFPVTYSVSQQLAELKLKGSLMRILQEDMVNTKNVPVECSLCKLPFCFCHPQPRVKKEEESVNPTPEAVPCTCKIILTREQELLHQRYPKEEDYMKFVKPKCKCPKMAKKHLCEHLPPYMRNTSKFASVELPNYEPCSVDTLKMLVEQARHRPPPKIVDQVDSKYRDAATQYVDEQYDHVCDCLSENELQKLCEEMLNAEKECHKQEKWLGRYILEQTNTPPYMRDSLHTFTVDRVHSLRKIIGAEPELEEVFRKKDCKEKK